MRSIFLVTLALVGCGNDPIKPDPSGTTGAGGSGTTSAEASSAATTGASTSVSTGTGQPAEYTGGARLKVRKFTASDGAEQQLGFHDSQLQIDCAFALAEDGQTRCLPLVYANTGAQQVFVDAGCTTSKPIAAITICSQGEKYVRIAAPAGMTCAPQLFAVLQLDAPATTVYTTDTCSPIDESPNGFFVTPIPASAFVAATESVEP